MVWTAPGLVLDRFWFWAGPKMDPGWFWTEGEQLRLEEKKEASIRTGLGSVRMNRIRTTEWFFLVFVQLGSGSDTREFEWTRTGEEIPSNFLLRSVCYKASSGSSSLCFQNAYKSTRTGPAPVRSGRTSPKQTEAVKSSWSLRLMSSFMGAFYSCRRGAPENQTGPAEGGSDRVGPARL